MVDPEMGRGGVALKLLLKSHSIRQNLSYKQNTLEDLSKMPALLLCVT